jgi:hypothetical protein
MSCSRVNFTLLLLDDQGIKVWFQVWGRMLHFPTTSRLCLRTPKPPLRVSLCRSTPDDTYSWLLLRLRTHGALPALPCMSSKWLHIYCTYSKHALWCPSCFDPQYLRPGISVSSGTNCTKRELKIIICNAALHVHIARAYIAQSV